MRGVWLDEACFSSLSARDVKCSPMRAQNSWRTSLSCRRKGRKMQFDNKHWKRRVWAMGMCLYKWSFLKKHVSS